MEPKLKKLAILIAGPTASGKSAFAIQQAKQHNGLIINADSMQIYDVLNILSSRPQEKELKQVEHRLYGYIEPQIRYSTGNWLNDVKKLISEKENREKNLIFVGGTGLYFKALLEGFISLPEVPFSLVKQIDKEVSKLSRNERKELLKAEDPQMAKILLEPDRQRLVRALSVLRQSGKSLAYWQQQKQHSILQTYEIRQILLNPDKHILNQKIALRFEKMLDLGAVEEVKSLLALKLDANLPVMKAIGVKQIASWLRGEISKEEMIKRSIIATRQYAKRQRTWFRKWRRVGSINTII